MLKDNLLENTNFLNSYLSERDFSFISSLDKSIQELDVQLNSLQKIREAIILFINKLSDLKFDQSVDKFKKLVNDTETAFNYVNDNIKLFVSLEDKTKKLNSDIVNLLIDISSHKISEDISNEKISDIKGQINDYSSYVESVNKDISKRNSFINNFFSDDFTIEFLNKFNISVPLFNLPENSKLAHTTSTSNKFGDLEDNNTLIISEKQKNVYLPYTVSEINDYLQQYPNKYKDYKDVIKSEFIVPLSYYQHFPVVARFRESYSLIRDREGKSIIEALKYAMDLMLKSELNPAIIAACKYEEQLENYLKCMQNNDLDNFTDFNIKFEINLK